MAPASIMEEATVRALTKPRHALVMSKFRAELGRPRRSWIPTATAGS